MRLWCLDEYDSPLGGSDIVEVTQLRGLLGRRTVTVGSSNQKLWATVSLNRVRAETVLFCNADIFLER